MANITNDIRFIRLPSVQAKVGLSRSQIYKLIDEGRFPAQVRLSASLYHHNDISIATTYRLQAIFRDTCRHCRRGVEFCVLALLV